LFLKLYFIVDLFKQNTSVTSIAWKSLPHMHLYQRMFIVKTFKVRIISYNMYVGLWLYVLRCNKESMGTKLISGILIIAGQANLFMYHAIIILLLITHFFYSTYCMHMLDNSSV